MFHISRFKFHEKGTTLVEIIVAVVIIAIFSGILVANFPYILKQFAISRVSHKLAQDIRKVQDLGFSGVLITEGGGTGQIMVKGYGIYVDIAANTKYLIYADRGESPNFKYDGDFSTQLCSQNTFPQQDCIFEIIDIADDNSDLYIEEIINIDSNFTDTSVNFSPPNPNIAIDNLGLGSKDIGIVISSLSEPSLSRTVWVNTSGLIRLE